LFKNGEFAGDYRGARSAEAISNYLIKKSGKPYSVLASFAEAEAALASEKNGIVVGYFTSFESAAFKSFEASAEASENIKYFVISDADAASSCELTAEESIAVVTKDGSKIVYDASVEDNLSAFANKHAYAQSMMLDPELFQTFLKDSIIVVTAYDAKAAGADDFIAMATEVVKGHNVKQMFADSNQWGQALVRMGVVSGNVYPTAVAFDQSKEKQGPIAWDEAVTFTKEGFSSWVKGVVAGTQATWKKSEPAPASNDAPVTIVVADEFEKIVLDNTKDVLVMFYAPWCGHCKNLAPVFEALGEKFKDDANVVISKMDATANFVDSAYGVQGFPTLKFFPAGSNDVLDYEGDRTEEDFVEFINTNRNTQA